MPDHQDADYIFVQNLLVEMSAGIYDHEKAQKQRVIINIRLKVEGNKNRNYHHIDDLTSYEVVVNETLKIAHEEHYDLIETLAEKIADKCLSMPLVQSAYIKIEKPDIIENTKSVGIEISRVK